MRSPYQSSTGQNTNDRKHNSNIGLHEHQESKLSQRSMFELSFLMKGLRMR